MQSLSAFLLDRAPFWLAGAGIGVLVVVLLYAQNAPFGSTGGFISAAEFIRRPSRGLDWRGWMFVGVIAGGLLHALLSGTYDPSFSYGRLDATLDLPARAALLGGAGVLIGYGARTARGCTAGHGICGMALASPMSIVATMTFMATAVGAAHLLAPVLP